MADVGSVTVWLSQLQGGDPVAAERLWDRYFHRLQGLARHKLPTAMRHAGHEEDIALEAFASLWRGSDKGQFPELASRDHLWRLLVVITIRKAHKLVRTETRERAMLTPGWELEQALACEPDPGFELQAAEECQRLMAKLGEERLESIARWRMEGLTVSEMATRLACCPRTIDRKLARIQSLWSEEIEL